MEALSETTYPGSAPPRQRWLDCGLLPGHGRDLGVEPRRALALLRALELDGNQNGALALLSYAGVTPQLERGTLRVSARECQALADALRRGGYPLSDDGIVRFKEERGHSRIMRISPDVAAAYARYVLGNDARLRIENTALRKMSREERRALRVLLVLGQRPDLLRAIHAALGVPLDDPEATRGVDIGRRSARRLVAWAEGHGISFEDRGLQQLYAVLRLQDLPNAKRLTPLARQLARWILAPDEPEHDYTQVLRPTPNGERVLVSQRTLNMLRAAGLDETNTPGLTLVRGSYEHGRGKGAHPHQGGGVVDVGLANATLVDAAAWAQVVARLRGVGFAAWFRARPQRPHVHAVAIGDRELGPSAAWQIKGYFQGRDGRSRSNPDPHATLAVTLPEWAVKYGVRYR